LVQSLLRSSSSVGANYFKAWFVKEKKSTVDFDNKIIIVEEAAVMNLFIGLNLMEESQFDLNSGTIVPKRVVF